MPLHAVSPTEFFILDGLDVAAFSARDRYDASPETVEREIINRVEKSLQSIPQVYMIRSNALESQAQIVIIFNFKKNMSEAADEIRNAINAQLRRELRAAIERLEADDEVQVIILTGTDPAFTAGLDLKELGSTEPPAGTSPEGVSTRSFEDVAALKANIEQALRHHEGGWSFDRMALFITSGAVTGRKVCRGTLSFETMSEKHMRRSLVDSVTLLTRLGCEAEPLEAPRT